MECRVVITKDAQQQFDKYLSYLAFKIKSKQATKNVLDDFKETKAKLALVAKGMKYVDNEYLRALGYKRINFMRHRYFMLFRVVGDVVYVDQIFHVLQDYENKMQ